MWGSTRAAWRGIVAACVAGSAMAAWGQQASTIPSPSPRDFSQVSGSPDAKRMVDWVRRTRDAVGRPYAVIDKKGARIFVFDASGRFAGESVILLGQTWGDDTAPGVGERAQTGDVRPDERTTPAGRFEAAPGHNLQGEHVVWVDHAAAFAIHRLRPGRSYKFRAERMATPSPDDNRVSLGCVVVPVPFYLQVVEPLLGRGRSVVYVLPETRPLQEMLAVAGRV